MDQKMSMVNYVSKSNVENKFLNIFIFWFVKIKDLLNKSQDKTDKSKLLFKTVSISSQYKQLCNYYYNYNYDINDPSFHLPPISNRSSPLSEISFVTRNSDNSSRYTNKSSIKKSNKKLKKITNQLQR